MEKWEPDHGFQYSEDGTNSSTYSQSLIERHEISEMKTVFKFINQASDLSIEYVESDNNLRSDEGSMTSLLDEDLGLKESDSDNSWSRPLHFLELNRRNDLSDQESIAFSEESDTEE